MWSSFWSVEEDKLLIDMTTKYGPIDWSTISRNFRFKTREQARIRFLYLIRTKSEEELTGPRWDYIQGNLTKHGFYQSVAINKITQPQQSKPKKYNSWSSAEDETLIQAYELLKQSRGKWSKISKFLPNRSRHSVIKRFSIVKKSENIERLLNDVWLRKPLISNYQYGHRNKPIFESLVNLLSLEYRVSSKYSNLLSSKDKLSGDFLKFDPSMNSELKSILELSDPGNTVRFFECYDIWFEKLIHLTSLINVNSLKTSPEISSSINELNDLISTWETLNPHNFVDWKNWPTIVSTYLIKIQQITDKILKFDI
ncbi:hypothetical protein HZS_6114, partial [Henneguya salminicola]